MIYYNEYLDSVRYTNRDQIAELIYTAEHNFCINELRSNYIMQNLAGVPRSVPLYNSCHWKHRSEDHDTFLAKLKVPTVEMVFKSKNLDKLHEKIASINMVFEFIEKTILSYQDFISRITSSTKMMKILDISTG
jgi:hypothetical protein